MRYLFPLIAMLITIGCKTKYPDIIKVYSWDQLQTTTLNFKEIDISHPTLVSKYKGEFIGELYTFTIDTHLRVKHQFPISATRGNGPEWNTDTLMIGNQVFCIQDLLRVEHIEPTIFKEYTFEFKGKSYLLLTIIDIHDWSHTTCYPVLFRFDKTYTPILLSKKTSPVISMITSLSAPNFIGDFDEDDKLDILLFKDLRWELHSIESDSIAAMAKGHLTITPDSISDFNYHRCKRIDMTKSNWKEPLRFKQIANPKDTNFSFLKIDFTTPLYTDYQGLE